jgi:hypothetical protein
VETNEPHPRPLDRFPTERRQPGELTKRFRAFRQTHRIAMTDEQESLTLAFMRQQGARPLHGDPPRAGWGN